MCFFSVKRSSTILRQDSSLQCKTKIHETRALTWLFPRNTWEYKPPAAKDIPQDFRVTLLPNARNPHGVLSSKVKHLDSPWKHQQIGFRRRVSRPSLWESLFSSPSGMHSTQAGFLALLFVSQLSSLATQVDCIMNRALTFLAGKTVASPAGGNWVSLHYSTIPCWSPFIFLLSFLWRN